MKHIDYIIIIFLIPFQLIGQSHIGVDILNNKKSIEIPFDHINGMIIIKAKYDNVFNFNFIFDTGATNNIIFNKNFTDQLGHRYSDTINVYGADFINKIDAYITRKNTIKVHNNIPIKRDFIVLDNYNEKLAGSLGIHIHGILGGEFIKGLITTIDYKRKKLILQHPNHFTPLSKPLPIKVINKKPYISTYIYIADSLTVELMLLDTGSSLPLLVRNSKLLMKDTSSRSMYLGLGLGGEIYGTTHKLDSIKIGDTIYKNLLYAIQNIPDSLPTTTHTNTGIIGSAILANYRVTIDYLRMRVYLEESELHNQRLDKSGIVIQAYSPDFSKYIITFVEEESPAEKAGLKKGDIILKYKWTPRILLSLHFLRKKLSGKTGKRIRLRINRAGNKSNISFKLDSTYKLK